MTSRMDSLMEQCRIVILGIVEVLKLGHVESIRTRSISRLATGQLRTILITLPNSLSLSDWIVIEFLTLVIGNLYATFRLIQIENLVSAQHESILTLLILVVALVTFL